MSYDIPMIQFVPTNSVSYVISCRDYKPAYEKLKQEKAAELLANQQKQLQNLQKDVGKDVEVNMAGTV